MNISVQSVAPIETDPARAPQIALFLFWTDIYLHVQKLISFYTSMSVVNFACVPCTFFSGACVFLLSFFVLLWRIA